jgi:hypothetical protein
MSELREFNPRHRRFRSGSLAVLALFCLAAGGCSKKAAVATTTTTTTAPKVASNTNGVGGDSAPTNVNDTPTPRPEAPTELAAIAATTSNDVYQTAAVTPLANSNGTTPGGLGPNLRGGNGGSAARRSSISPR